MKRAKCATIEADLLERAGREAAARGLSFSALVEEALRLYLSLGLVERRLAALEERLAAVEEALRQCLGTPASRAEKKADHAGGQTSGEGIRPELSNVWIDILRRRG